MARAVLAGESFEGVEAVVRNPDGRRWVARINSAAFAARGVLGRGVIRFGRGTIIRLTQAPAHLIKEQTLVIHCGQEVSGEFARTVIYIWKVDRCCWIQFGSQADCKLQGIETVGDNDTDPS